MSMAPHVTVAVEGDLDERVAVRLVEEAGGVVSLVHGRRGKQWLRRQIDGYRYASRQARWLVLVDLDRDRCPPQLRSDWGVDEDPGGLCFRVAVRSVESWLLADRGGLSRFLGVTAAQLPTSPDRAGDPKKQLLAAAERSRSSTMRDALVPRKNARVGPLYSTTLSRFVDRQWDPAAAAERSPSLASCRARLAELLQRKLPNERR